MGGKKHNYGIFNSLGFTKGKFTTFLIIFIIAAVFIFDSVQRSQNSPLNTFIPNRSKGKSDAPLRIVEFIDFQCPNCARGSLVLRKYMYQYPEGIYLTVKYYSLGELNSTISAVYAECAARQNKFWPFHDILINKQSHWRTAVSVKDFFHSAAQQAQMNDSELKECVKSQEIHNIILQERAVGESNFVRSTPTYFINGEMVVGAEALEKYLNDFFLETREDLL